MHDPGGSTRTVHDVVEPGRVRALAATLDLDVSRMRKGAPLPEGWHWVFFHEAVARSELGPDGHEARGSFLPDLPLERRMWAGGRLDFVRPLTIGAPVQRTSTVRSVVEKEGRSGPLAFVTVAHEIHDDLGLALEERQDLVYLNRPPGGAEKEPADDGADDGAVASWRESFVADAVTLFRFSALTFNGHRIHYDHRYATGVEGYADLVVHGPLIALLLLGAGARQLGRPVSAFEYRAQRPAFCDEIVELCGAEADETGELDLWARVGARTVMTAKLLPRDAVTK